MTDFERNETRSKRDRPGDQWKKEVAKEAVSCFFVTKSMLYRGLPPAVSVANLPLYRGLPPGRLPPGR